jgi:quercetin dioxygenase-like cupin family protein
MHTINEKDVQKNKLMGRDYKLMFNQSVLGVKNLCGVVSFFPAKMHAPGHIHKDAEEVIYVLKGNGYLTIGNKKENISPGTVGYIPKGKPHSINNTGNETIKLYCVFSPPIKIGNYKDIQHK